MQTKLTIMMSLFDEDQIMKSFIKSERHEADVVACAKKSGSICKGLTGYFHAPSVLSEI